MNEEPIAITLLVIDVLDELGIRYLIAGSLASSLYGEPRATRDADLLADMKPEHIARFVEMLEVEFNVTSESIKGALTNKSSFNLIHYQSLFKIDIFIPKTQFDEKEFQRRTLHLVSPDLERHAYLASIEDVILAKLDWYRKGNCVSDQQWRHITGLFNAADVKLDIEYMQQTAHDIGVIDLLSKLV